MKSPPLPKHSIWYTSTGWNHVNPLPKHNRYTQYNTGWNHVTNGGLWSHFQIMLLMVCEVIQFNTGWPLKKDSLGGAENFNLPILTSGKSFCQMKAFGLCPTGLTIRYTVHADVASSVRFLHNDWEICTILTLWPPNMSIHIHLLTGSSCNTYRRRSLAKDAIHWHMLSADLTSPQQSRHPMTITMPLLLARDFYVRIITP